MIVMNHMLLPFDSIKYFLNIIFLAARAGELQLHILR